MLPIIIKEATEADLSDVLYLYQQALEDKHVLPIHEAQSLFARMMSYPKYKVYMAVLDGQAVGTFALLIMDNLGHGGTPSGVVEDVAVLPDCQGKGIGKQMMEYALEKCREAGCYKMALSSNVRRGEAHAFYESLGFRQHGYSFLMEL